MRNHVHSSRSQPRPQHTQPIPHDANIVVTVTIHGTSAAVKTRALGTTPPAARSRDSTPSRNESPSGMAAICNTIQSSSRSWR